MSDDPERTAITWATFLHLYMPFYTFQYAIGISAAHAVSDKVRAGEPGAAENYLAFLKAGGSIVHHGFIQTRWCRYGCS